MDSLQEVRGWDCFQQVKKLEKGWSSDDKYQVSMKNGQSRLVRVSAAAEYDKKSREFKAMQTLFASKVPMSEPLAFGRCNAGSQVYMVLSWCEGDDAEIILPGLSQSRQYNLGFNSGQILKKIHSLPAPSEVEDWEARFNQKVDRNILRYEKCGISIPKDAVILKYLRENRNLLANRPQCFQHGDYHTGNMIISPQGKLSIIDFNRSDYGDPWEEFNRIVWSARVSPAFATGQLHGYFDGSPPIEFFQLLVFYMASNALSAIPWAIPFGEGEIKIMVDQARQILTWFNGMTSPIPTWYFER